MKINGKCSGSFVGVSLRDTPTNSPYALGAFCSAASLGGGPFLDGFFGEVLGRFETSISSKPQCEAVSLSIKNIHICTQLPITLPCLRETHSSRCYRERGLLFQCAVCTNVRCWTGNARSNVGPIWNFHLVCNKIRPSKW